MDTYNAGVMGNVLAVVESGSAYGARDYKAYAGRHQNSQKEATLTIGWAQFYGPEAQTLYRMILARDPAAFRQIDSIGLEEKLGGDWAAEEWNPSASEKAVLIAIADTEAGHACQDDLWADELNRRYVPSAIQHGVTGIKTQMMYIEIMHLGGENPAVRIFSRMESPYTVEGVLESLKKDQDDGTNTNQVGDEPYYTDRHCVAAALINKYARDDNSVSAASSEFIVKVAAVARMAHDDHFTYGDSHGDPPCADQVISCDRLEARALWDMGFRDQGPRGFGESEGGSMDAYMDAHPSNFRKITDPSELLPGDMICVGENGNNVHTFVLAAYNPDTGICSKYDAGSQDRINNGIFFSDIPLIEWAGREFLWAWRLTNLMDNSDDGGAETVGEALLANCSISEHGTINGTVGDQTGHEYYVRTWYQHNPAWKAMYRPKRDDVAAMGADFAKRAAENDHVGYGQGDRTGMWLHCMASDYDPNQITINCNADCSSSTVAVYKCVGHKLGIPGLEGMSEDMYTGDADDVLMGSGEFDRYTDSRYLVSGNSLMAGDILLASGHIVIVCQGAVARSASVDNNATPTEDAPGLNETPQWVGTVTADSLHVRTWAGTNHPDITSWPRLSKGNPVDVCDTVRADDGSLWYYVWIAKQVHGFVSAQYIK